MGGLDNYIQALSDPQFWESFDRVLLFLVVQVPIMLALALGAALAIDSGRLRGASFFRILVFLPYAVPAVVAVLMWGYIYGDQFGLAGNINHLVGFELLTPVRPGMDPRVDRQHRHLGVRRLQHADLLLRTEDHPPRTSTRRRRSTVQGSGAS